MIDIRMARRKSVAWIIFSSVVTPLDLVKLREAGAVMQQVQGNCDVIHDWAAVTRLDIPDKVIEAQGAEPPHAPERVRAMITKPGPVRDKMLFYSHEQVRHGFKPPTFVNTIDEAMNLVGCRKEEFVDVDTRFLDELEMPSKREAPVRVV